MNKVCKVLMIGMVAGSQLYAQKTDSVIINVGEKSKVIFAIGDKADLQTLKQYNFQAVVDDLVAKLEKKDSTSLEKPADDYLKSNEPTQEPTTTQTESQEWRNRDRDRDSDDDWDRSWDNRRSDNSNYTSTRRYYGRRTYHSFNFDLGTNNFVTPDYVFPNQNNETYSVRPWGSWYVAVNSIERTRLARKVFLEWGIGASWYNFKFESDKIRMSKDADGVVFSDDQRDLEYKKSKLTATYINASLVPVIDFGGRSRKAMFFNGDRGGSFRIGIGPYAGYRIGSYTKLVYNDDGGDKRRERDRDSFYLNNIRYGLRLQIGVRSTDLFFNYDMNELFADNKGPKLNAFSFGITF
ncbi:MAG TPA: hypothetical protein VK508_03010 [Cyclobacteriaceae bacterium]|nr:hypothetical protein [Cyclobacteriaceae bacterium]